MTRYRDRLEADHYQTGDPAPQAEPEPEDNGETKADLINQAQELGITPANAGMTKAELQAAIDAHHAEPGG